MNEKPEILVLGDSHAAVFNNDLFRHRFPGHRFTTKIVHGATASGLENPNNSKTQAYPNFMRALAESTARQVIVTLGEVDTGFVIWYRAKKYQESVEAMTDRAVAAYTKFLTEIAGRCDLLCMSAPLPTIKDGNTWGEVANLRREVTATQLERTELTLIFNERIQSFCLSSGISYLMLDPSSLGSNGVVRDDLLNKNPRDHHYDWAGYSELIVEQIKQLTSPAWRALSESATS